MIRYEKNNGFNYGITDFWLAADQAKKGTTKHQEYTTAYAQEIETLNYLVTASEVEYGLAANLVDTLVDYDRYGVIVPCLATEWKLSDDNLTWTFKIREGVKWVTNEGKEYAEATAQDFVDAMKYILIPKRIPNG